MCLALLALLVAFGLMLHALGDTEPVIVRSAGVAPTEGWTMATITAGVAVMGAAILTPIAVAARADHRRDREPPRGRHRPTP